MTFCFEKFVGFIRFLSDEVSRIVVFKKLYTFSNSTKITQNKARFSYFIKLYEYWGNFQSSCETKNLLWKR